MTTPTPPSSSTYAPGWYPDSSNPGSERYFDGTAWTSSVRPAPSSAAVDRPELSAKRTNILGVAALVCSVIGAVFACIPGALFVGWVLLPVGFVLGVVALFQKGKTKWQGLAALILAVVGTIVGVIVFVSLAAGAVGDAIDDTTTEEVASGNVAEAPAAEEEPAEAEPAIAPAQELVLGETAFGVDTESGMGWYAVELTNPNKDYIFSGAGIDVEAYDANDVLIDTDSSYGIILSGTSFYVGNFFDIGSAEIDRIEVRGPTADAATHSAAAETGSFDMGELKTGSEYDWMNVSGTVTSNFSEDQDMVRVDVVARKAGKIVGIDTTYTDRVPAGGTAAWNVDFWSVPLDSQIEAFPHL
ncbi:DUF2510 domain-containing protein [Microbacterium sp. 1P06AB]|uniref:DUF2510 domain-containing protein n=1 Tax=Microbacterium sp. 1P06AB TaxID=3132289 RepID=UPI0039A50C8A